MSQRRERDAESEADRERFLNEAANYVSVPSRAIKQADLNRGWDYVLGTVFPELFADAVPPADPYDPTSCLVHVLLNMDANVEQQTGFGPVSNTSGMFLWLPIEAYNSLWHFGFVPSGYTEIGDIPQNGFISGSDNTYANGINTGIRTLVYDQELAVPYGVTAQNYTVRFSPGLARDYRSVRAYNGGLQFSSTTVSLGANTLGGRLNASVIPDTVDIAQKSGEAYSTVEIITASVLSKEKAISVGAQDGIRMNIGDDIREMYQEPNAFAVNDTLGPEALIYQETYPFGTPLSYVATIAGIAGNNNPVSVDGLLDCFWISPRATTVPVSSMYTASSIITTNSTLFSSTWVPTKANLTLTSGNVSQIGESDWLDIQLRYYLNANVTSAALRNPHVLLQCKFHHCFVSIDSAKNGTLAYRWFAESRQWQFPSTNGGPANDDYQVATFTCRGNLQTGLNSMSESIIGAKLPAPSGTAAGALGNVGKYLGTFVTVNVAVRCGAWSDELSVIGNQSVNFAISQKEVYAQAHDGDSRGTRGPAHILRYDDLSVGQNISISGQINLQAVAQANLQQLTKAGSSVLRSPIKQDFLSMVHTLYTTESIKDFKAVYPLVDYNRLKRWMPEMTYSMFARRLMLEVDANHPVAVAAAASGMMEDLANAANVGIGSANVVTNAINGPGSWQGKLLGRLGGAAGSIAGSM